jgi:uncharacterized protein (TIGR02145 family)
MYIANKSRNIFHQLLLVGIGFFLFFIFCCDANEFDNPNLVTTLEINFISETKAYGGGKIENNGRGSVLLRGICWDTLPDPTIKNKKTLNGSGDGSFISELIDLIPGQRYYVRAFATNADGTAYGNNISFITKDSDLPVLNTKPVSGLTSNSLISGGNITFEGKSKVLSRGVCWSVNNPPLVSDKKTQDGEGIGEFISEISGLNSHTPYYIRAYASNKLGTGYGKVIYVKPFQTTVADIEGNIYFTVSIGTQVWTVENLKVKKYQNGDPIPNIQDNSTWNNLEAGAYCDYENDSSNRKNFGILYNWYAASDSRNLAPEGWRVASYEDYQVLVDFLGGPNEAEEKMIKGDFNALASGKRNRDGNFFDQDLYPYFWTSTEYHKGSTWARYLVLDGGELNIHNRSKNYGFPIRCVRE